MVSLLKRYQIWVVCILAAGIVGYALQRSVHFFRQRQNSQAFKLACAEVHKVGLWAKKKYGGPNSIDFQSKRFSKKVSENFIQLIDPFHVLLTEDEARSFGTKSMGRWDEFIRKIRCDFFENWIQQDFQKIRKRFLDSAMLALQNVNFQNPQKPTSGKTPVSQRRAKNETELRQRVAVFISQSLLTMPNEALAAYAGKTRRYFEEIIKPTVFETEYRGTELLTKTMLTSLDRYSMYFSSSEFEEFYEDLAGGTSGVGVQVRKIPVGLYVEKVIKGSPAELSGSVRKGDIITAVDGQTIEELSLSSAKKLLKGEEASVVSLKLERQGTQILTTIQRKPFAFDETRMRYSLVRSPKDSDIKVALFEIPAFYGRGGLGKQDERSVAEDIEKELNELGSQKSPPSVVLLDLRNNPGGYLEEAVGLSGLFLGDKAIVGVMEHRGMRVLRDIKTHPIFQGPLIVLLDENSASASEVLAGALKDYHRAVLIGSSHTYGKGSIQRLFRMEEILSFGEVLDGKTGVLKLTTSVFYSPAGHSPLNGGVTTHFPISNGKSFPIEEQKEQVDPADRVADIPTLISEAEMEELHHGEQRMATTLALLKARRNESVEQREAFKKSIRATLLEKEEALEEALAIAFDYASLKNERSIDPTAMKPLRFRTME